jgi:hypothetical protein
MVELRLDEKASGSTRLVYRLRADSYGGTLVRSAAELTRDADQGPLRAKLAELQVNPSMLRDIRLVVRMEGPCGSVAAGWRYNTSAGQDELELWAGEDASGEIELSV